MGRRRWSLPFLQSYYNDTILHHLYTYYIVLYYDYIIFCYTLQSIIVSECNISALTTLTNVHNINLYTCTTAARPVEAS